MASPLEVVTKDVQIALQSSVWQHFWLIVGTINADRVTDKTGCKQYVSNASSSDAERGRKHHYNNRWVDGPQHLFCGLNLTVEVFSKVIILSRELNIILSCEFRASINLYSGEWNKSTHHTIQTFIFCVNLVHPMRFQWSVTKHERVQGERRRYAFSRVIVGLSKKSCSRKHLVLEWRWLPPVKKVDLERSYRASRFYMTKRRPTPPPATDV